MVASHVQAQVHVLGGIRSELDVPGEQEACGPLHFQHKAAKQVSFF